MIEANVITVRPSTIKAIFAVPFEPDPHFISREIILSSIKEQLNNYRRTVLYGLGGTG
jgi:hypothetical protein